MISLIVPVYNIEPYLGRCVSSILAQTYRKFELILVDDGSTDGSSELCDAYAGQDGRVTVIHKENGGLVSARKAGLAAARGEYAGFVDGDDWIEPCMYARLAEYAVKYQADMVLGGSIEDVDGKTIHNTNRLEPGIYDREKLRKNLYPHMLCAEDFFCMGVQPYIWNKLMRRELAYAGVMAVDDRIRVGEDVAAVMPMLLQADRVIITDYCDYHYCVRGTSMMWGRGSEEKEWEELCILHKFLQTAFLAHVTQGGMEYQLGHYTVGNMLTRAYGKLARKCGEEFLWPFGYRLGSRACTVYSAGNFGRAVYGYLQNCYPGKAGLWVDREYQKYQALGLPVHSVGKIPTETEADILVAVLDMHLAEAIREDLLRLGVRREQIYCIDITDDEVREILDSIERGGGETDGAEHIHSRRTFKGADTGGISYKNISRHENQGIFI